MHDKVKGLNLAVANPDLASQWHPTKNGSLTPKNVSPGSGKKVWWVCLVDVRHEWEATVNHRARQGRGCPVCSGHKVISGVNDLATQAPALATQWHPIKNGDLTPSQVTPQSNKKVWWVCATDQRHTWESTINNRYRLGNGCPVCAGKKSAEGFNDLATLLPELAAQWHSTKNGTAPQDVAITTTKKAHWVCSQGHEWVASVRKRAMGQGCPVCAGVVVLPGFNDLATTHPDLAAQWHPMKNLPLTPCDVTAGSDTQVWWSCSQGHEWQTWVYARKAGQGCPRCALGKRVSEGETQLVSALQALGLQVELQMQLSVDRLQSYDIYLPEHKVAIEYNGVFWHSEARGRGPEFHREKWATCRALGITLYQVWEDDWRERREVVLRGLAHRLGMVDRLHHILPDLPAYYAESVGARNTCVTDLDYETAATFLEKHHIQGSVVGSYYLGLVDAQERLRAVLVLKRTGKTGELSIERYATAGVVPGGFSKLLKHAEKILEPQCWVTFADLSISDGGLYEKTGFVVDKVLPPDYSYLVRGKRVHKFNYRLARFKSDPTLHYEEGLTERELAALNGLYRVWDSGKIRYIKEV